MKPTTAESLVDALISAKLLSAYLSSEHPSDKHANDEAEVLADALRDTVITALEGANEW